MKNKAQSRNVDEKTTGNPNDINRQKQMKNVVISVRKNCDR